MLPLFDQVQSNAASARPHGLPEGLDLIEQTSRQEVLGQFAVLVGSLRLLVSFLAAASAFAALTSRIACTLVSLPSEVN